MCNPQKSYPIVDTRTLMSGQIADPVADAIRNAARYRNGLEISDLGLFPFRLGYRSRLNSCLSLCPFRSDVSHLIPPIAATASTGQYRFREDYNSAPGQIRKDTRS